MAADAGAWAPGRALQGCCGRFSSLPYKLPTSPPTNSTALAKDRQCQWLAGQDRAWTHFDRITLEEREGNVVELVTSFNNFNFDSLQRIYNENIRHCVTSPPSPCLGLPTLHAGLTTRSGRSQTSNTTYQSGSTLGGSSNTSYTPSRSSGSGPNQGEERDNASQGSTGGDGNSRSEPRSTTSPKSGFKCPVWEKHRGKGKIQDECKDLFDTREAVVLHANAYHLRCPICHHDPVKPKKRCHSTNLTKGKTTLKSIY
ncbi:hypothetical protein BDD12DRAFT_980066, partial [Trichophaea hybrida]